jgi:uncharacterized protein
MLPAGSLFEIFGQRHEHGSTTVPSNLTFEQRTSVFGIQRLTGALLDCLTHRVHILELNGESYRLKQSMVRRRRAAQTADDEAAAADPEPEKSPPLPQSHVRFNKAGPEPETRLMINYADAFLRNILLTVKTIAMVGASDKETRPSYVVFSYLLARGYQVIGVNPSLAGKSVHGAAFFKTLADVPEPVDMVDIFRNSQVAGGVVNEALALDPRPQVIWMQLGVRDDAAAARAQALGVEVVMNRCPKMEYERLAILKA